MSRAKRRHHLRRMKEKAKRIYHFFSRAPILANHLQNCSCYMCGNRRKHEGPTRQEKLKDDLDDRASM